jgi:hypothetical protein
MVSDFFQELSEAVRIVSQHKTDCERIESGMYPCNPLPRHSHTVELFLAMRMLAFEYVKANKDERDE